MSKPHPLSNRPWFLSPHIIVMAIALTVYVLLGYILPTPTARPAYNFTPLQIFIIRITVLVPWIATAALGTIGYVRLRRYAESVPDRTASRPFRLLSMGIMVLIWSLVIASIVGQVRSHYIYNHAIVVPITIFANYLYALAPLVGFAIIWKAVRKMSGNPQPLQLSAATIVAIVVLVGLAVSYIALIFTNPNRQTDVSATIPATYYLPDWLTVATIALPVIASWVVGFAAVARIREYQRKVSGIIYRKFMGTLSYGVALFVSGSILYEGLLSLGTQRLLNAGLGAVFVLIYLFLTVQFVGYLLVSKAAKKLTIIEEV